MPRGFRGESVAQEARGGSRAAVERGRAAASRSFQTAPMEDSSRFEQANPNRDERGSYNPGDIAREALTFDQFMTATGRSETNPYGDQGIFSRMFGIDPNKLDYSGITPGGIATLNKVNALAYDQYLNPRDARGNIRGMLREGSPTQYGTVAYDPSQATDFGLMGNLPIVGPLLQRSARRSGLTIFDDYMGDLGNELAAFPKGSEVDYSGMGNELLGINPPRVDKRLTPMSFPGNVDDLGNELDAFPEPEDRFAFEDRKGQRQAAARPPQTVAEILMQEPPAASITVDRPRVTDRAPVTLPSQSQSAPSVVFPEESSELPIDMLELLGIRQPGDPLPDLVPSGGTSLPAPVYIIPQGGFADPRK